MAPGTGTGDPQSVIGEPNRLSNYHENRTRKFTRENWQRLLERQQHEAHPHAEKLRAGIEQFREMLER